MLCWCFMTNHPPLTETVQKRRLVMLGHIWTTPHSAVFTELGKLFIMTLHLTGRDHSSHTLPSLTCLAVIRDDLHRIDVAFHSTVEKPGTLRLCTTLYNDLCRFSWHDTVVHCLVYDYVSCLWMVLKGRSHLQRRTEILCWGLYVSRVWLMTKASSTSLLVRRRSRLAALMLWLMTLCS